MRDTGARRARCLVVLAALGLLAGCGPEADGPRATTCRRALPALASPGAGPTLLRVGPGSAPGSVRVDYRAGTDRRPRWILCRFGRGTDLVAVTTEGGALGGAALYLLKRHYLDTPDAAAADPSTPNPSAPVP